MTGARRSRILDEVDASGWIEDGMTIAIGSPPPMGMVRQIIRRRVKNLTVVDSGLSLDMLVAAGCVRNAVSYYAGGGFGVAVAPSFRRAAEHGEISVFECDEGTIMAGLQAAAQSLPFMPWRGGVGTSLPEVNPELKLFNDPISGQTLLAVPPIRPDVSLLHAAMSDVYGNVQHVGGPGWLDLALHRAADRTIVQVERIIPNEEVRANPRATTIASADAIVRAPYGAHPFYSRGFYIQDQTHLREYLDAATKAAAGDDTALTRYLALYCREPQALGEYLERIGIRQLLSLYEY
jgi:glutaconate CoA-transferase subunit A